MALIVPHFNLHLLFRMGRLLMKSTALIEQAGGESRQLGKSRRSGLSRLKIIGEQAVNQVLGFISTILLYLALTGALGGQMSVCLCESSLSRALFLYLSGSLEHASILEHSMLSILEHNK